MSNKCSDYIEGTVPLCKILVKNYGRTSLTRCAGCGGKASQCDFKKIGGKKTGKGDQVNEAR